MTVLYGISIDLRSTENKARLPAAVTIALFNEIYGHSVTLNTNESYKADATSWAAALRALADGLERGARLMEEKEMG